MRIFDPVNKWWHTKRYFFPSISQRRACDCDVTCLSTQLQLLFCLTKKFILGPSTNIIEMNYINDDGGGGMKGSVDDKLF